MSLSEINRRLDNYFEVRKNLWTAFIVLTGGIVALALRNTDISTKIFLISAGFFADLFLMHSITKINESVETLLNRLKGETL
jgi:hypothetical protein